MKKTIAVILAVCMSFVFSATSFAAEINQDSNPKTSDITITASVAPTYTVTIPSNVNVAFNAETTAFGSVKVDSARIEPNKCIKVSLTSDGELNNAADSTKVIPYTVKSGDSVFTSATYSAAGEKTDLTVNISADDWNRAYAGEYRDTVTFEVSYINK